MQEYNRCLTCGDEIPNGCLYCVSCIEESEAEEELDKMTELGKKVEELSEAGRITDNDKCCICGKVLFIDGKRQTNLCYHLGLNREQILKNGWYGGGSESGVYICKSCFSRKNHKAIMSAIWKGHERAKRIRKQRGEE